MPMYKSQNFMVWLLYPKPSENICGDNEVTSTTKKSSAGAHLKIVKNCHCGLGCIWKTCELCDLYKV